jgi:hypothetical protein
MLHALVLAAAMAVTPPEKRVCREVYSDNIQYAVTCVPWVIDHYECPKGQPCTAIYKYEQHACDMAHATVMVCGKASEFVDQ